MLTTRPYAQLARPHADPQRAFDQAFNASPASRVWVPAMDVAERGDAYVVHAELPA
jgi:HSP20 family molecular chaperone IbpA